MFTGIVKDLGEVVKIIKKNDLLEISIRSSLEDSHFVHGNSIAVNGVCLTVESFSNHIFNVSAVEETLKKTNLSKLNVGDAVNLEYPLSLQTPIAGHLVSGHVDAVAEVISPAPKLEIALSPELLKYFPIKGSITINGVSLTVADQSKRSVSVALIPETMKSTNLAKLSVGDLVNIEVDLIVRYLESLK